MQIYELLRVARFLRDQYSTGRLKESLNQLKNSALNWAKTPQQNHGETIYRCVVQVQQHLRSFEPAEWNERQISVLGVFDIEGVLGNQGVEKLDGIKLSSFADPHKFRIEIESTIREIENVFQTVDRILTGLGAVESEIFTPYSPPEGSEVLCFRFTGDIEPCTVEELADVTGDWRKNFAELAKLNEAAREDVKLYSVQQGSFLLNLILAYRVAKIVFSLFRSAVELIDKHRLNSAQIQNLNADTRVKNAQAEEKELGNAEKIARLRLESALEVRKLELETQIAKNANSIEASGEQLGAIRDLLQKFELFVAKGGSVSLMFPDQNTSEELLQIASETEALMYKVAPALQAPEAIGMLEEKTGPEVATRPGMGAQPTAVGMPKEKTERYSDEGETREDDVDGNSDQG